MYFVICLVTREEGAQNMCVPNATVLSTEDIVRTSSAVIHLKQPRNKYRRDCTRSQSLCAVHRKEEGEREGPSPYE